MMRTSGIAAWRAGMKFNQLSAAAEEIAPAVVPEIDHRVGEGLECVVQPADALETQQ